VAGLWDGGEFVLQNYITGSAVEVSPAVAHALSAFTAFTPLRAIEARFGGGASGRRVAKALVDADILVTRGSEVETLDAQVEAAWAWGHDARFFHFSTRRTRFRDDFAAEFADLAALARDTPPPPPFLALGGSELALVRTKPRGDFWATLRDRHTRRHFRRSAIRRDALATILEWTWGATRILHDPGVGEYALRTSPSGGSRHPVEAYVFIHRVRGVRAGLYHYHSSRHALELVRHGDFEADTVRLCANQPWVADAAAVFVMTGVLERSMWKYRQSHAYRVLLLDMGHLGQTFHLVCTRLGLAPFTTAALDQPFAEETLGLDPTREVPLYAAAAGHSGDKQLFSDRG
jgi:SagB-type dehydrogenase family enzyme